MCEPESAAPDTEIAVFETAESAGMFVETAGSEVFDAVTDDSEAGVLADWEAEPADPFDSAALSAIQGHEEQNARYVRRTGNCGGLTIFGMSNSFCQPNLITTYQLLEQVVSTGAQKGRCEGLNVDGERLTGNDWCQTNCLLGPGRCAPTIIGAVMPYADSAELLYELARGCFVRCLCNGGVNPKCSVSVRAGIN